MTRKESVNPASEAGVSRVIGGFSSGQQKLSVPPIEGHVMYWFLGMVGRLQFARQCGWEHVVPEEIGEVNLDLAGDAQQGGHDGLGHFVSRPAQEGVTDDGQFLRLYLMKLKKEFKDEDDEAYLARKIEPIIQAFKAGTMDDTGGTQLGNNAYRKKNPIPDMFNRGVMHRKGVANTIT